ncbi:MAG TPA: M6 family metalloprotease domain-containing protein [Thermoanaerobaculia bacterium]
MGSAERALRAVLLSCLLTTPLFAQYENTPHVFVSPGGPRMPIRAQAGDCSIAPRFANFLTEGPTDRELHAPSVGTMRAVMLFVDFPDAPSAEQTQTLYDTIVPKSQEWFAEVSHGRFNVAVTPVHGWRRMPLPSTSYGFDSLTFEKQKKYFLDAIALTDADVDFSPYDTLLVVSSAAAKIPVSPTYLAYAGAGVPTADGRELRWGVTFGNDVRVQRWGEYILAHETQHMLGLPDLYRFTNQIFPNFLRDAGGWDVMSWIRPGAHAMAWHKRKLGWIDETQIACAQGPRFEATLTPTATDGGVKAIVVRVDDDTAIVAELRRAIGADARLCDSGLLIYTVDASTLTGFGPVKVLNGGNGEAPAVINECGPIYDATFDIRNGKLTRVTADGTITFELVSVSDSEARVRVLRPLATKRRSATK